MMLCQVMVLLLPAMNRFRFTFRFSLICIWAVGKETFLCSEICVLQPLGVAALAAEPL